MRKALLSLLLLFLCIIFLLSWRRNFSNIIHSNKWFYSMGDSISVKNVSFTQKLKVWYFTSDRFRNGDIYGMCYLPKFKIKAETYDTFSAPKIANSEKKIDLYISGDSFLADKNLDSIFIDVRNVYFFDRRWSVEEITPTDTGITNILIYEATERNINTSGLVYNEIDRQKNEVKKTKYGLFKEKFFHNLIDQNLEMILFDNLFFTPIKELKSWLNYFLFHRLANGVSISKDESQLYLSVTTDSANPSSSTFYIHDHEIDTLVVELNTEAQKLYTAGFAKVYLSIIPNSVSVVEPENINYNKKLTRIENNKLLKIEPIRLYDDFLKNKHHVYMTNDAHWNNNGFNIWVTKVNNALNDFH